MNTRRATTDELLAVRQWIITAPHGQSCVTGVQQSEDNTHIHVRLYSARCLHGPYSIPKSTVIEVIGNPRC